VRAQNCFFCVGFFVKARQPDEPSFAIEEIQGSYASEGEYGVDEPRYKVAYKYVITLLARTHTAAGWVRAACGRDCRADGVGKIKILFQGYP